MIFASLAVVSGLVAGELGPGVDRVGGVGGAFGEERFVYRCGKACVVYVAAESSVIDPLLVVLDGRGNVVSEDDDGGGGTTASVGFRAQEGEYTVIVSAVPTGTVGSVEVWLREVPLVPPERREEFEAAVARREEAERLYAEGRLPEAREAVRDAIERGLSISAEGEWCEDSLNELWRAGLVAQELRAFEAARRAWTPVDEVRRKVLPATDPIQARVRGNLAIVEGLFGNHAAADALFREAMAVFEGAGLEDSVDAIGLRSMIASNYARSGRVDAALGLLFDVVARLERMLGGDTVELVVPLVNLGDAMLLVGDTLAAREAYERALRLAEGAFAPHDPRIASLRNNLSVALNSLGDWEAARILQERILEERLATLDPGDSDLRFARQNLAITYLELERPAEALRLLEEVHASLVTWLPATDPQLVLARANVAVARNRLGRVDEAAEELEECLVLLLERTGADSDHVQRTRMNLASIRYEQGRVEDALALLRAMEETSRRVSLHPERARMLAENLAKTMLRLRRPAEARGFARRVADSSVAALREAYALPPRAAEQRAQEEQERMGLLLGVAARLDDGVDRAAFESLAFTVSESLRGVGLSVAARIGHAEDATAARTIAVRAGDDDALELLEAVRARDGAQAERLERSAGDAPPEVTPESVAALLGGRAVVAYRRVTPFDPQSKVPEERLVAFVVTEQAPLACVDLGPIEAVRAAVVAFRARVDEAIHRPGGADGEAAIRRAGEEIRRLVLDPLVPRLGATKDLVLLPDDALHLVPFDALPVEGGLVADRWSIRRRLSLHGDLVPAGPCPDRPRLVALGAIDYGAAESAPAAVSRGALEVVVRRAAPESGFEPLRHSGSELRAVEHAAGEGGAVVELLRGREATSEELARRATGAGLLHLSTHGWFSGRSPRSTAAASSEDLLGIAVPVTDPVGALSPLSLCGLALAGANAAPDAFGRRPGLMTAEEVAALDLRDCGVAVVAACETARGLGRPGQGLASLQKAFHLAGADVVVSTLWEIPDDEVLGLLMTHFYRGLLEDRLPAPEALSRARRALYDRRVPFVLWAGFVATEAGT